MSKELKAITIRGPWPWWIMQTAHWRKDIENRTHARTGYLGPLAIHVSKKMTEDDFAAARWWVSHQVPDARMPQIHWLDSWLGCIVGVVDLVTVSRCDGHSPRGWGEAYCYHWHLENPRLLGTPVPAKGCQACPWNAPPVIAAQVWAQLNETGGDER